MKKIISISMMLILCMTMLFALGACGTEKDGGGSSLSVEKTGGQWASLEGKSLMIYCGAGMKQAVCRDFGQLQSCYRSGCSGNLRKCGADRQSDYYDRSGRSVYRRCGRRISASAGEGLRFGFQKAGKTHSCHRSAERKSGGNTVHR